MKEWSEQLIVHPHVQRLLAQLYIRRRTRSDAHDLVQVISGGLRRGYLVCIQNGDIAGCVALSDEMKGSGGPHGPAAADYYDLCCTTVKHLGCLLMGA